MSDMEDFIYVQKKIKRLSFRVSDELLQEIMDWLGSCPKYRGNRLILSDFIRKVILDFIKKTDPALFQG